MSYKTTLMSGTSVLALLLAAATPAAAQATDGQFVFGITSAVVTASVGSSTTGTTAALSSQVNNDLSLLSAVGQNTLVTGTGATTAGGSAGLSSNVMSATAIANQFSNASGTTYVLDPSYAPSAGFATLGTSQLNYNTAATTNTARLGLDGSEGNSIAFTAGDAYGAPVSLNSNSFAARVNGNLTLSSVSGAVPLGGFATGPASIIASGTSAVAAPVGASIVVTAPVSLSNVQQNITSGATTTSMTASTANTAVSALFNGATGFNGGSVTVSSNSVTAVSAANSATVALDLSAASNPTLAGGVSVFSAQGNNANLPASSLLAVGATNTNTTLRIMSEDPTTVPGLTQISNSNATLAGNTISSRAALNDITSQTLTTGSTLSAGGSLGATGGTTPAQLFGPTSVVNIGTIASPVNTGSVNVSGDYLNVATQNNLGAAASATSAGSATLTGTATVQNPVVGFFGGVSNGAVSVQGNTISGAVQGNVAAIATIMPLISGSATSLTGLMQRNVDLSLTSTVDSARFRISDTANLLFGTTQDMDVTTGNASVVAASASGSTFTSATLNIGSADTAALGNSVRATAFANSGSASATLGQVTSGANAQVTAFGLTGSSVTLPIGTQVALTAPTSVAVIQENRGVATTAQVAHSSSATGTTSGLFQIDAYNGLTNGAATIGNNSLRSTAVGNFGEAAAALTGAAGNTLAGGVAVGTFQGNSDSTVNAFLGGLVASAGLSGPVASIGVGALSNSTATVASNTFAAVAVGNSATGLLAISAGTILGGTVDPTAAPLQYTNASTAAAGSLTGSYVVGNSQTNSATTVAASNLDAVTYAAGIGTGLLFADTGTTIATAGYLPSRMNIGATSFTSANALVTGNTVSTTAVSSEYNATVSGLVTAVGTSATTATVLSLGNTQRNMANATVNSTVRSVNIGNTFLVSTAASGADGTVGNTDNTGALATAIATNSVLSVTGNTASAAATANSARLGVTGIANSGADAATFAATLSATDGGTQSSAAALAITNGQSNTYVSVTDNTPAVFAGSGMQNFGVNFGRGAATTGSTLQVNTNAMTATATANSADLSATLATGPAYQGGIGLNNMQRNLGALNTDGSSSTTNTTVQALVSNGFFNVGTSRTTAAATPPTISNVEDSTVSVSSNRMVATATQNTATLSVTAAASTQVQASTLSGTSNATAATSGTTANAAANIAGINVQTIDTMDSQARATYGYFSATADALDSTVAVNSNVVGSIARGNTAETSLSVPRIDGTMEAFNAQSVSNGNIVALTDNVVMSAATNGTSAATTNTAVSVSSNLISAASTVNNYAATMSGLGQAGAATVTQASGAVTTGVTRTTGTLTLGNSQLISGGTNTADVRTVDLGINLANTATTSSPLSVNSNTVSASANGNVSAQSILANGSGADSQAGMGNYSAQSFGAAGALTNSAVIATAGGSTSASGVNILVQVAAETGASGATGTMTGSPVSVSSNSVSATATANTATLSTTFDGTIRSGGSAATSSTAANVSGTVTADYALASVQLMTGSLAFGATPTTSRAVADVGNVTIGATLSNSSTTASPLDISSNSVTATANGNVSALSMIGNVSGAAVPGGSAILGRQIMDTSLVSATNTSTTIRGLGDGSSVAAGYMLTNSPVTISGNMVGASATGNSASLNSGFASSVRYNGTGTSSAASTAVSGSSTANGDYVLLNSQRASGSTVQATTTAATISFSGASTNGPVNLQGNTVFATAFGNSATMAMSGAQAGGSMQSTNYQQTNGTTVNARITGTTIQASMANAASSSAPIAVSGNIIRAVAVGNSVANSIGR